VTIVRIVEIFDSLQGEGFWTGVPMTFVRLAGCNAPEERLACLEWCDTPESWDRAGGEALSVEAILRQVHFSRVCLTGGEPLLQLDGVGRLLQQARRSGLRVHLETNGTIDPSPLCGPDPDADGFDWAVVSPKPPDYRISSGWVGRIDELKLIVDRGFDATTAERLATEYPGAIVSIQPEAGETRPDRAIALVMSHPEWRLSLQTHKLLGIR